MSLIQILGFHYEYPENRFQILFRENLPERTFSLETEMVSPSSSTSPFLITYHPQYHYRPGNERIKRPRLLHRHQQRIKRGQALKEAPQRQNETMGTITAAVALRRISHSTVKTIITKLIRTLSCPSGDWPLAVSVWSRPATLDTEGTWRLV